MSATQKKTVLITGSTSGIGMAVAKMYAAKGYNIIFNGLEPNGAEIAAQIAAEYQVEHLFFPANMADPQQIRDMAAQSLERFGAVDILINNAGIQFVSPVKDFPEVKWDAIIDINLNAAFHMTKALWPAMEARKFGRIINIASAHGLIASAFKSAYVSSKFGIIGLTKTLALEGGPHGITANAVCPGYVFTPIVENQIPDQMKTHNMTREEVIEKIFLKEHAVKEFIPVEAIAESVLFLTESAAAPVTTGIALSVDAGWTAH